MARKYLVETFGCQMNFHDSERLAGLLEQEGSSRPTTSATPTSSSSIPAASASAPKISSTRDSVRFARLPTLRAAADRRRDRVCSAAGRRGLRRGVRGTIDVIAAQA